jgi:ubiquinone/menaquinone biosynthesis C-methylase UbiE
MQGEVEKSYDKVAAEYAEHFANELAEKPFDRKMLDWLIEKCPPGEVICDMGCGPAQIANYLRSRGARVCGFDVSAEMLANARQLNSDLRLEQHDMLDLSAVEDASLGGIAAFYSIIHVPRDKVSNVLSEFRRILTPGGVVLLTFHIGTEAVHRDEWWGKSVDLDFLFFETKEMKDYVEQAKLVVEESIEREPYPAEYQSRRAYIFARKV